MMGTRGDCEHIGGQRPPPASSREADHRKVSSPRMTPTPHPVALSGLPTSPYTESAG